MKVYGLDFTSSPSRSKPLTLADCDLEGRSLRLKDLRPLVGTKKDPFKPVEEWLETPGPWIAGIDFPFGQPRKLILDLTWPMTWEGYVSHVATLGKKGFEATLRTYKAAKPSGSETWKGHCFLAGKHRLLLAGQRQLVQKE